MKRVDVVPSTDESYLSLDTAGVGTRASVLTLDGRASVITKDCSIPVNDVTSKYVCPWARSIPPSLCRRHRTAWDMCGLVVILCLCLLLILVLCFLHPCLFNGGTQGGHNKEFVQAQAQVEQPRLCLSSSCVQTAASLLGAMNLSADPCQDFFQYACGTWNVKHVIPEDRSSISTFEVLADQLQIILKGILEAPVQGSDHDMAVQVKKLYQSCSNVSQINAIGEKPLRDVLESLGGWPVLMTAEQWKNPPPLVKIVAESRFLVNQGILMDIWVGPDDRSSSDYILQMDQPHLGLPSREYYLSPRSKGDMEAYHTYMTEVAVLLGAEREVATEQLQEVILFESELANITSDDTERQDTGQWYNKMNITDLEEVAPEIDWRLYLTVILSDKLPEDLQLVNYATPYFQKLGNLLSSWDSRVVYNYVIWRVVMEMMPYLPPKFQDPRTEFRRVLLGVLAERNRWNMCVEWTNKRMGMAVSSLFVVDHFNHESKEVALEMIHGIRAAYNELLEENHWMDKETRMVAKEKANMMKEKIGYPDYILNATALKVEYNNIQLNQTVFLENIMNLNRMEAKRNLAKIGTSVNMDLWSSSPAVVNAFYSPNKNDIVIPAGILQPLFYSKNFPKSLNYGGIGVVIGHEITHGFDDKGRQFDKHGNLLQWWNNQTISRFRKQAQCIIDQYSGYKLYEVDLNVNGKMTQGENIADNGGLKQAYRAYRKWVEIHGEEELLPGLNLTHDQLFFLNYAQIWCGTMRPEDAQTKLMSSVHPPGPIRVIGPLSNSYDFAKAYSCPVGSKMNPEKKCSVW